MLKKVSFFCDVNLPFSFDEDFFALSGSDMLGLALCADPRPGILAGRGFAPTPPGVCLELLVRTPSTLILEA